MRPVKILLILVASCASGWVRAEAPPRLRLSWVAPLASWGSIWLEKKDLAVHLGKSYELETVYFAGTPAMISAMAAGELEIATLAYPTVAIAVSNAGIDDLRVIADEFQDGVDGYYSNEYDVLADGPVKTIEDLKGKVLATNVAGSAVDVTMRAMLRAHGLEDKRDYTVIETPFPTMRAMLLQKKADLVTGVRPFSLAPDFRAVARVLFTGREAVGKTEFTMFTVRQSLIDAHRAALVDFTEDTLRIVHWYLDPANHDAVATIAARVTKQPVDRFGWLFTHDDEYRDPNMLPDLTTLQKNVDMVHALGFARASFDVAKHADLSIVKEAAARLK
jgi:NitT/TauT family transport system substrate-binding protein